MKQYLAPTYTIDCDSRPVVEKAKELIKGTRSVLERGRKLFYYVRDSIRYNAYLASTTLEHYRASRVLKKGEGFCTQKAVLLAALARAARIPVRLVFADLVNYQISSGLRELMGTNLFSYHGYDELYINRRWIKATPAFDLDTCLENNIIPVEFDGKHHAIPHSRERMGRPHIKYVKHHGSYADLPFDDILKVWAETYGDRF